MEFRSLLKKTLFFIVLVLFIGLFTSLFGESNALVGVVIALMALMLLGKDLSRRPLTNLSALMLLLLAMGTGGYISLTNPYIGIPVNFTLVFFMVFLTMRDIGSPVYFPFTIGYALLLSSPVTGSELTLRMIGLAVGSVFVVGLNVLFHHGRDVRRADDIVVSMCDHIIGCIDTLRAGGEPDLKGLDTLSSDLDLTVYGDDHGRRGLDGRDRLLLDLESSLHGLGHAICRHVKDDGVLDDIVHVLEVVRKSTEGGIGKEEVSSLVTSMEMDHPHMDVRVVSALESLRRCMDSPSDIPGSPGIKLSASVREELRLDSVRTSFGIRMALLFTIWTFVWHHWGFENSAWLLFTTASIVQPYIDGSLTKSAMRVTGTFAGATVFIVIMAIVDNDMSLVPAILLLINYIYILLDSKRYDVSMVFITLSALLIYAAAVPTDTLVLERIGYILLGVGIATAANYLILPYRLRDENLELCCRYVNLADRMLTCIRNGDTADIHELSMRAGVVSRKISVNNRQDEDPTVDSFLTCMDGLIPKLMMACNHDGRIKGMCSDAVSSVLEAPESSPVDDVEPLCTDMDSSCRRYVATVADARLSYIEGRRLVTDAFTGTHLRSC